MAAPVANTPPVEHTTTWWGPRFLIYGLRDPRTGAIRYVGQSTSGLRRPMDHGRPRHLVADVTHKGAWIRSLRRDGLDYEVVILETLQSSSGLAEAERRWIAIGRAAGTLTNLTDGGDGAPGYKHTPETRERLAALLRSPEQRAKITAGVQTPAARALRSALAKGKKKPPFSAEHRRRISMARKGRSTGPLSAEHRAKISAAHMGKPKRRRATVQGELLAVQPESLQ